MTAKLYGSLDNLIGTVTLGDASAFPRVLWLDESPRGGQRLFIHQSDDRFEEVTGHVPAVRLDPLTENRVRE